jgi:site-specific DNA-methyltransferase (adenine-specific)
LIRLYTFVDDLVLDPFMGSGSALVAAARLGRRYIGYDTDPDYVEIARRRVASDEARPPLETGGPAATALAEARLETAGFTIVARNHRVPRSSVTVSLVATDEVGARWFFDVAGPFTSYRGGLLRMDTVWKALGRAHALRGVEAGTPLVLMASHLPRRRSEGDTALRAAGTDAFFDAIDMLSSDGLARLAHYAAGGARRGPLPGFWTDADLT